MRTSTALPCRGISLPPSWKPFAEIQRLLESGVYEPLLLTDDAGARLAYAWQVVLPGQRTALLDYFAVRYDLRGSGVGTAALGLVRDYDAMRVRDLVLECEHPAEAPRPVHRAAAHWVLPAGRRAGHGAGKPGVRHAVRRAGPALRRYGPPTRRFVKAAHAVQGHGAAPVLSRAGHILRQLGTYYPQKKGGMKCETGSQAMAMRWSAARRRRRPWCRDCAWAFSVGGAICTLGEALRQFFLIWYDKTLAGTLTSIALIFLSAIFTLPGWYQSWPPRRARGRWCPYRVCNSVVSPAIEFKAEGWVTGVRREDFRHRRAGHRVWDAGQLYCGACSTGCWERWGDR